MAKKKSGKQNAMVVYAARGAPPQSSAKKKNKKGKKRGSVKQADVSGYRAALLNPFSDQAVGARIPDMYAAATVTAHYSESLTVSTNVSGEADLVILPNIAMPWISPRGSVPSSYPWITMNGVTQGTCKWTGNSLATKMTNYRIVGYGVRVYSVTSYTGSAGRVMIGTGTPASWINYKNAQIGGQATSSNNTNATADKAITAYGLPIDNSSGHISAGNMPAALNSLETSLTSLATTPIMVTPKVTSPEAFIFKGSGDSPVGFDINNQTSTSYVSSGDASYLRVAGHEAIGLVITGATPSTSALQVELMYHLEGAPSTANSNFASDTPQLSASPTLMAEIVANAARSPTFKNGVELAGNILYPGLGTLARSLM